VSQDSNTFCITSVIVYDGTFGDLYANTTTVSSYEMGLDSAGPVDVHLKVCII
jgi:hypothetical protein